MNDARLEGLPAALELRGLSKAFGPVRAVADVSLTIPAGSIAGIVGENGAGKTTLMNLVYGLYGPDAGAILVDGREARIAGPHDALRLGIGMVHQHFMLVDTFTVLENVVLGVEGGAMLAASLAQARSELRRISDAYGLAVDPDALVGDLPVDRQQRIEIVKALYRQARILVLDEPTAVLTPQEADRLFVILRELAAGGVTIVLITHKLREIMALTDRVFVMRRGRLVAERATAATTEAELAQLMIVGALPSPLAGKGGGPKGRQVRGDTLRPGPSSDLRSREGHPRPRGEKMAAPVSDLPPLSGVGLCVRDPRTGVPLLDGVDIELHAGEIAGVAGVSGNGQSELLEILAGMRPLSAGRLRIGGREFTPERPADPAATRRLGVAHVPEHRHRHGMVGEFAAAETAMLGYQRHPGHGRMLLDPAVVERRCADLMGRFDVRPPVPGLRSASFSGGNQQKLVMAREVAAGPRILLVGQPTRGVDIGAIAFIHAELRALRDAGCAILLVSTELDEIVALADRILVMAGGRITGEVEAGEADPAALGLMMSGVPQTRAEAAGTMDPS